MSKESDLDYYKRRFAQERRAIEQANIASADPAILKAHEEMAQRYAAAVAQLQDAED